MSKGRLSNEEIESLMRDSDVISPPEVVATRVPIDAAVCPATAGDQWGRSLDDALPGATISTETALDASKVPEDLARNLGAALSEALRAEVPIVLVRAERVLYGDFAAGCKQPTCFTTVGEKGSESRIAVDISLSILLAAINRMLGGSLQDAPLPVRPLTQIEKTLAERFIDLVVCQLQIALGESSHPVWEADPVVEHPDHSGMLSATQTVACIEFVVQVGSASGLQRFAVPWALFERATLGRGAGETPIGESSDPGESVKLSAVLAKWRVSLGELGDLQVGNVIELEADVDTAIEVELDGDLQFYASPGALRGNRAVRIEQIADLTFAEGVDRK